MKPRAEHVGLAFTIPALVILGMLTFYPLLDTLILSFHKIDVAKAFQSFFIGLANYERAFKDPLFQVAFINTLEFVIGATTLESLLGLILAIIFAIEFRGKNKIVPLIVLPMMLPTIVICSFWRIMYHTEFGVINAILKLFGLGSVNWLGDVRIAMLSIIIVDLWQYTPFAFLIIYAGIQSIPSSLIEASLVDGATFFQSLRYVVLPLIKKHILIVIMLRIIDTFRIFDKVFALTGGGPGNSTEVLTFNIYKNGFRYYDFGYAAAQAVIMLLTILIVIVLYLRVTRGGTR